ncbi:hypothetical protein KUL118_32930 [Tenacibaculum sp. KUL118]|nr:hypothetical protein KUL118_32930 [Tenacibaculum sp. KUL118]
MATSPRPYTRLFFQIDGITSVKQIKAMSPWPIISNLIMGCAVGEFFFVSRNVMVKKPEERPMMTKISSE